MKRSRSSTLPNKRKRVDVIDVEALLCQPHARTAHVQDHIFGHAKDRRKLKQTTFTITVPVQPDKHNIVEEHPDDLSSTNETRAEEGTKLKNARASKSTSVRMQQWLRVRSEFLDEVLRHDGLQDISDIPTCSAHNNLPSMYRCCDCLGPRLHCQLCIVEAHQYLPLHRIEVWADNFWDETSLSELGLVVQLGHSGHTCPMSSVDVSRSNVTVIDINGIHKVTVQWCTCRTPPGGCEHRKQLMRVGWYPATLDRPSTAFTFQCLDTFHLVTLQGKLPLYDFYNMLVLKTDNIGIQKPTASPRWNEISAVTRQWRHLKMLKRAGRGHDPAGILATPRGACAILCPACPQPGLNLPNDWQLKPTDEQWKYRLIVAIDACFKLKLKARGIQDPELGSGWAYFVDEDNYQAYLATCKDQKEISTCTSELKAVKQAYSKGAHAGVSVTGVVGVKCARHAFILPNGVSDLQKGERYCNVDYAVLSALKATAAHELRDIDLSYDIACSWMINFMKCVLNMPPELAEAVAGITLRPLIPKAHIEGHGPSCRTAYSFNYAPGVAESHGETTEQEWAIIGPTATSTREMGPGVEECFGSD